MLDRDLALLYEVQTKALKQAVRRNTKRFPIDFMFTLSKNEFQNLRSQIVTSSWGDIRYMPMVFTEHGIAMLSSILKSDRAIDVNVKIVRVFVKMRSLISENVQLKIDVEEVKSKITNNSKNIELVFSYLDELLDKKENEKPITKIGYKN
tara:strand:- start:305 stop:754 length:450 start_codon:yes stop_codon:yes gene_type:complete